MLKNDMRAHLRIILPIFMVVLMVSLYWPSLQYLPFFDDKNFFVRGLLDDIFLQGFSFQPRWLPYFTTAWIDLLFEDRLFVQRITNLALHLATAFVLYSFFKQVSNHVVPHRNNERAALAATLLFLLHPLTVYAVGYLIQRTILMATLFGLLSLSTYFDGLVTRKKAYFMFSAFFYLLSAFSKEHAVLIPAAALALTPLAVPMTRRTWRELVLPLSLYVLIALLLVALKAQYIIGNVYEPFAGVLVRELPRESQSAIWALSVMTQATLFFKYMGLLLIPYQGWMSIDMRVPFATHFGDMKYVVGSLGFLLYGLISLRCLFGGGRIALAGFALLAPWLLFLVEFSVVKIQEPFVLYRSYLWVPLFFLLIPAVSRSMGNKAFWTVVMIVSLGFGYSTRDRLESFSSGFSLWDDAVRKLPSEHALGSARMYSNRGVALYERKKYRAAIEDYTRALSSDATFRHAYKNRAIAYMAVNNYHAALRDADVLIRLDRRASIEDRDFFLRGVVYLGMRDFPRAIQDFTVACEGGDEISCFSLEKLKERMAERKNDSSSKAPTKDNPKSK